VFDRSSGGCTAVTTTPFSVDSWKGPTLRAKSILIACRIASLVAGFLFALYLAAAWPGHATFRSLFIVTIMVTATMGFLPSLVVALLRPVVVEEAEGIARLVAVELGGQLQQLLDEKFEAERRHASASDALRARLLDDPAVGRAPVRALRVAGKAD
jgi:hypothetical protein